MRRQIISMSLLALLSCTVLGKRPRKTPHFITGLGDGFVRRGAGADGNAQPGDQAGGAVHPGATATDDIFQVTKHQRRNKNPNPYRLRPGGGERTNINERLARMKQIEEGQESGHWDNFFRSSSSDNNGISGPMRSPEQWKMSAFAIVGMIVFLSAIFLHLITDSSSSGGGPSGHAILHNNPKFHHSRVHRQRNSHGGTAAKKKTDQWSEDEEDYSDHVADYTTSYRPEHAEGQTSTNPPVHAPLVYPYQTRHRKPSASGYNETFNAAAYSPGGNPASSGFHSRSYFLPTAEGPVLPSAYVSPGRPHYERTPKKQQQQQQPNSNKKYNRTPQRTSITASDVASPGQPQKELISALDNEFVAAGLESFDVGSANTTPLQQQRQLVHSSLVLSPKLHTGDDVDDDEESQHALSDAHSNPSPANSPLNRQPSYTHADEAYTAYGQIQMNFGALHMNSGSGNLPGSFHDSNNASSSLLNVSSHNPSNVQAQQQQNIHHYRQNSASSNQPSNSMHQHRNSLSSNHSGCLIPQGYDMGLEETPRAGLKRRTVDVVMDKTPKMMGSTATPKQAYQAYNTVQKWQQHQQPEQYSNNMDDPFRDLRLPSPSKMHIGQRSPAQQQANQQINLDLPLQNSSSSQHQVSYSSRQRQSMSRQEGPQSPFQQSQHAYQPNNQQEEQPQQSQQGRVPFIPTLDMAAAAGVGQQQMSRGAAPRSMLIEELQLMKMESGSVPHWQVRQNTAKQVQQQPQMQQQQQSQLSSASSSAFSVVSDEYEAEADNSNDPRKGIVHKRPNLISDTDATSSLQSSIGFSDLKLEEVIGGGGFGQVWKAVWNGTPVAVKVLTGSAQAKHVSKAILEEFAAEINLLKGMRHPNICLYMGASVDPPNRAIITELAANGSLWDALRLPLNPPYSVADGISRHTWPSALYNSKHGSPPSSAGTALPPVPSKGSWPWILVKGVALGAARGMAYLHGGNPPILHRDLKSANILLNESYTAKVCDFGLSRLKAQERSMTGNCGTVQWMAPEVLANQSYNEAADVFSFGIILIELLTRECPYEGMSAIQCALAVLNRDYRPEIPKWCPPTLRALIKSCVKKEPDERPSFAEVIVALDAMP